MLKKAVLTILFSLSISIFGYSQSLGLSGLDRLRGVVIEPFSTELPLDSFTSDLIKLKVESELSRIGFDFLPDSTFSYIYINVHSMKLDDKFVYNMRFELSELVLVKELTNQGQATTWSKSILGYSSGSSLVKALMDALNLLLSDFIEDWYLVNG